MRWAGPLLVLAALLLATSPSAAVTRSDSSLVESESAMQYHVVQEYKGLEAQAERARADTDQSGSVSAAEASAYAAAETAARLGNATAALRWDGSATYWSEVSATAQNFVGTVNNQPCSLILDGLVSLASAEGANHTLTITNLSGFSSYSITLSFPVNWSIIGVTGVSITSQSQNSVAGNVDPAGFAVIQVNEEIPPPPPLPNDTQPPVVNPGGDRAVAAGQLTSFNGSAADNDPGFPGTGSFWWVFMYNATLVNITGQSVSYTFWALGVFPISFTAVDASGNRAEASFRLTVGSPDLEAPVVSAGPDLAVTAGNPVALNGSGTDNDPLFPVGATFWWTFLYNGTLRNLSGAYASYTFWTPGVYAVTLSAMDAWGNRGDAVMRLTVESPDQQPPVVDAGPDATVRAGDLFARTAAVSDDDPAFPAGSHLFWTFMHNGSLQNITSAELSFTFWTPGAYILTFSAMDAWGNLAADSVSLIAESPDRLPPLVDAGADDLVVAGAIVALNGTATDNDAAFASNGVYWWTFFYNGSAQNLSGQDVFFRFDKPGTYELTLWARDGWGNTGSDTQTVVVNASAGPGLPPGSAALGFEVLLPASLLGAAVAAVAGVVAYRRRSARAALAASALSNGAASPPAAAAPARPPYVLEGLLLLYKDGRLIHHHSGAAESRFESPEVVGSMFTAVTEFIRDSFQEEGALSRLTYGQNTILLERSPHLFGAAIAYGEPDEALRELLSETLARVESAFTGVVERWNGELDAFGGVDRLIAPLFAVTAGLTRADVREAIADKSVKLLSGTEHYRGYVRLRVAIVNYTNERITDASVTIDFNENVLRLARVDPAALAREGLVVQLGEVAPGERVGAIYYLDPLACSETNIEGSATYKDAQGADHTVAMKTRKAEIVCPIFFTPEHANVATLRRLVETSLVARDSKLYRVRARPPGVSFKDIFAVARESVQRHDVKIVRQISTPAPFSSKAWFYGQTKHSKDTVVIRVSAAEERGIIELFVAAQASPALTGLLAEFNHSFTEMIAARLPSVRLDPVLDDRLKGILAPDEFVASEQPPAQN